MRTSRRWRYRRFPVIHQQDTNDCGPACLAALACYHGLQISIAQARIAASTDRLGTSLAGLVAGARALGFDAKGVRAAREALDRLPLPVIAHLVLPQGITHFVVLYATDGARARVMDPADGTESWRTLDAMHLSGHFVVMLPGPSFRAAVRATSAARRLLALLRTDSKRVAEATALALVATTVGIGSTIGIQQLVDRALTHRSPETASVLAAVLVALATLQALITFGRQHLLARVALSLDGRLIGQYLDHLLRAPLGVSTALRVGDLISRVSDAGRIRLLLTEGVVVLSVHTLVVIGTVVLLSTYDQRLAILVLLSLPPQAVLLARASREGRRRQRHALVAGADLEAALVETFVGLPTIKRFGADRAIGGRLEAFVAQLLRRALDVADHTNRTSVAADWWSRTTLVTVLWYGVTLVLEGRLSTGELMASLALLLQLGAPVAAIVGLYRPLQDALLAADRLYEAIELPIEPDVTPIIELSTPGTIRFEGVSFAYGARALVLDKVSFTIPSGQITAIVGSSGSGKSTIAALLQRLYEPTTGRILIGDRDLRDLPLSALRRGIGVVPQQLDLFDGSILCNVALGEESPDPSRAWQACVDAGIADFVRALPEGLSSRLGERGLSLSGGQRQRLCLARALYKRPSVLVLDEATSALDADTEHSILQTLRTLAERGCTVVAITHRLRVAQVADHLVVIQRGGPAREAAPALLVDEVSQLVGDSVATHRVHLTSGV